MRGKRRQGLVEVVHLHKNADTRENHEDVCRGMLELVVASKGELDCDTKRLDGHDRDGSNSRADGEVDQWVLLSVDRSNPVDHNCRKHNDNEAVEQVAWYHQSVSLIPLLNHLPSAC